MKVQGTNYETYKLEVKKGSLIKELKTYTITGYTFLGFFKDEACTVRYEDSERVTKNSTVYCKYAPTTYTISYPTNQEGYIVNAEPEIEYGNKFIFTVNILDDYNKSNYIVKVNGEIIESNEYSQYIIDFVETNINITVENVVKNKPIMSLNFGETTIDFEIEEDATLNDVITENETLIKTQVIAETLKNNPNTYTQEQLSNLSITDLMSVTTSGIYTDETCTEEIDLTKPLLDYGDGVDFYISYATLDKLVFSNGSVSANFNEEIVDSIIVPKAHINKNKYSEITIIGEFGKTPIDSHEAPKMEIVVLPNTIKEIAACAFYNCKDLQQIIIPNGVTTINAMAFNYCSSLLDFIIPNTVTRIGSVYYGCSSLEKIVVESGNPVYHSSGNCLIETASKKLMLGCKNSIIPSDGSVTSIGYSSFEGCVGLTEIRIPNSIISIEWSSFSGCTSLTDVYFLDTESSWKARSTIISAAELQDSKMAATLLMEYANSGLTKVIE